MIDCNTQAQSGDDDMGGDNVAVSMEESKMDDFFQEVVMVSFSRVSTTLCVPPHEEQTPVLLLRL